MERWLTTTWTTGPRGERVPDYKGVAGIKGCSVCAGTANDSTECLVRIVKDSAPLDILKGKAGVHWHGDESSQPGPDGQPQRVIPADLHAALKAEAMRLGADASWSAFGYSVGAD